MALKSAIKSIVSLVRELRASLIFRVSALWSTFDIRLFFFLGGLILLGYGLYLYLPWVSFSVCGVILMVVGWLMEGKR